VDQIGEIEEAKREALPEELLHRTLGTILGKIMVGLLCGGMSNQVYPVVIKPMRKCGQYMVNTFLLKKQGQNKVMEDFIWDT
jgi:hypothetical protein